MRDKKGVERRKERKEKKTWARRERKNKNNGKHSPPLGVLFIIYIYTKRANNASKFSIFNSSLSLSLSSLQLIPRYGRIRSTTTATYPFPFFHFARNFFPLN